MQPLDPQPTTGASGSGPSSTSTSGAASSVAVTIQSFAFMPQMATATADQTLTWTNMDSVAHTVTSDDGTWDSGPLQPGETFSVTLAQPGTYAYHCSMHPFMQGTAAGGD